eukprot:TRINITY_DN220_c0_g2_i2.p1 TRINITY_DN220_c0_g2~~TRINITY_DN220_c0_g2_i2.p1  ORF type:complete len:851 (+),score=117.95 TRINITY_DN220_c0_g2_i2:280-2832(+)
MCTASNLNHTAEARLAVNRETCRDKFSDNTASEACYSREMLSPSLPPESPSSSTQSSTHYSREMLSPSLPPESPSSSTQGSTHYSLSTVSVQIIEVGTPGTNSFGLVYLDEAGCGLSPWRHIPLYTMDDNLHVICTTPRGGRSQMELARREDWSPLRLRMSEGKPLTYSHCAPWHLGVLPQTYADQEQCSAAHFGLPSDNCPLEVIDIDDSSRLRAPGEVYAVKPLASFAVINPLSLQLSWKVVAIPADDSIAQELNDVCDVAEKFVGTLEEIREWLRICQCRETGSLKALFGLNERAADATQTRQTIDLAHLGWEALNKRRAPHRFIPFRASIYAAKAGDSPRLHRSHACEESVGESGEVGRRRASMEMGGSEDGSTFRKLVADLKTRPAYFEPHVIQHGSPRDRSNLRKKKVGFSSERQGSGVRREKMSVALPPSRSGMGGFWNSASKLPKTPTTPVDRFDRSFSEPVGGGGPWKRVVVPSAPQDSRDLTRNARCASLPERFSLDTCSPVSLPGPQLTSLDAAPITSTPPTPKLLAPQVPPSRSASLPLPLIRKGLTVLRVPLGEVGEYVEARCTGVNEEPTAVFSKTPGPRVIRKSSLRSSGQLAPQEEMAVPANQKKRSDSCPELDIPSGSGVRPGVSWARFIEVWELPVMQRPGAAALEESLASPSEPQRAEWWKHQESSPVASKLSGESPRTAGFPQVLPGIDAWQDEAESFSLGDENWGSGDISVSSRDSTWTKGAAEEWFSRRNASLVLDDKEGEGQGEGGGGGGGGGGEGGGGGVELDEKKSVGESAASMDRLSKGALVTKADLSSRYLMMYRGSREENEGADALLARYAAALATDIYNSA